MDPPPRLTDPVTDPGTAVVDPAPAVESGRARGVLRNLASGHFRGVAALRLQQNFAEEIEAAGIKVPDPAPAPGRGRAYQRLLAQYQPTPPVEPHPQPAAPAVDVAA